MLFLVIKSTYTEMKITQQDLIFINFKKKLEDFFYVV